MKKLNLCILILLETFVSICVGQTKPEDKKAEELIQDAMQNARSDESNQLFQKLEQEVKLTLDLTTKIDSSNSPILIQSKDTLLLICTNLISSLDESRELLETRHGKLAGGELKNKMDSKHVNHIFLEEGNALKIKFQIQNAISQIEGIGIKNSLNITSEDFPLQLNLFMEEDEKTWEEYIFKDMPAAAVLPLITKYRNDIILTKLMVLEQLAR